jgi:Phytanoyl-CoA dioxygenase (PhyH)
MEAGLAERQDDSRTTTASVLTHQQCASFRENGFLSVPAITTAEDLARIAAIYDRAFARKLGWEDGNYFDLVGSSEDVDEFQIPHLQQISHYCPELLTTRYFANAAAAAAQLLGARTKHIFDSAITKPPHSHAETPWHQDAAFVAETSYLESLVVWMPLQPVDQTNGCMSFIPGSHRGPVVTHRSPHGDNRINGLEAMDFDRSKAVACPVPAGGATFHHFRTLHGAGGNYSESSRRVLTFGFGIRHANPTIVGTFDWLAAKDNERLHRYRSTNAIDRIRRIVRPYTNRIMMVLDRW